MLMNIMRKKIISRLNFRFNLFWKVKQEFIVYFVFIHSSIDHLVMKTQLRLQTEFQEATIVPVKLKKNMIFGCLFLSPTPNHRSNENNDNLNTLVRQLSSGIIKRCLALPTCKSINKMSRRHHKPSITDYILTNEENVVNLKFLARVITVSYPYVNLWYLNKGIGIQIQITIQVITIRWGMKLVFFSTTFFFPRTTVIKRQIIYGTISSQS